MTTRYRLDLPASAIAAALGAEQNGDVWAGGTLHPGSYAPVVVRGADRVRRMIPRLWGVPPPPRGERTVATVRNIESPFWIGTLRHTQFRCLVPATAFWQAGFGWTLPRRGPLFALAGIWRDSEVPSFALLTSAGRDGRALPVILRPGETTTWLAADWKTAQELVGPPSPDEFAEQPAP